MRAVPPLPSCRHCGGPARLHICIFADCTWIAGPGKVPVAREGYPAREAVEELGGPLLGFGRICGSAETRRRGGHRRGERRRRRSDD